MKLVRPKSIIWFERLFIASLLLFMFRTGWNWVAANSAGHESADWWINFNLAQLLLIAFSLSLNLILWYFIARRASNIAKWILVAITALGFAVLVGFAPALVRAGMGALAISPLITHSLVALSILFLFQKDSRRWFREKSDFRETPADLAERFR